MRKSRRDRAAEFWKKYQNQVLAAAVLIVLASAGFRYWQYERQRATEAAGDQFQQALTALESGKYDEAKAGLDKIATQGPSGYRALAQMTAAGAQASKDPQGAIGAFDAVAGDAAIDPLMRDTARLRAALLRVDMPAEQQKGEATLTCALRRGGAISARRRAGAWGAGARTQGLRRRLQAIRHRGWATPKPRPKSGKLRVAGSVLSLRTGQRRRSSAWADV